MTRPLSFAHAARPDARRDAPNQREPAPARHLSSACVAISMHAHHKTSVRPEIQPADGIVWILKAHANAPRRAVPRLSPHRIASRHNIHALARCRITLVRW